MLLAGGTVVTLIFAGQIYGVLQRFPLGEKPFPALPPGPRDDVREVGMTLFSTHNLPFQVIGVLILVASIGVIVLSKRELK